VISAAAASAGPLFGGDGAEEAWIEGRPVPPEGARPRLDWYDVGPDYFRTLGVPLLRGRTFTEKDGPDAPRVAVLNESAARRLAPNGDALGARVRRDGHRMTVEVVGVVADTRPFRPDAAPSPEIYWPYSQAPRHAIHFVLRTADASLQAPSIRARLLALDPDLDIGRFATLEDRVQGELITPRFNLGLVAFFALLAVAIAVVGIYGVVSYTVAARTQEIGVRLALGARPLDVLRWVMGGGLRLLGFGLGAGLVGTFVLTRLLRSLLVQVSPADPLTLVLSTALLALVVLAACLFPARRASRVDPAVALRWE
jgi:putative ABC transport system permease protein